MGWVGSETRRWEKGCKVRLVVRGSCCSRGDMGVGCRKGRLVFWFYYVFMKHEIYISSPNAHHDATPNIPIPLFPLPSPILPA